MSKQLSLFSFVSTRSEDNSVDEASHETSHEPEPAAASTVTATDDIAVTPTSSLSRPINVTFPKRAYSDKERSFNPLWYNQCSWLEYSVKKDAAFCFPCRLFPSCSGRQREKAFTVNGFRDWKHATGNKGGLFSHQNCHSHSQSVVAWEQFKATSLSGTVVEQLGRNRSEMIQKNRHYIQAVSDVLLTCCKEDIAIHGHREMDESMNRGNFMELVTLLSR